MSSHDRLAKNLLGNRITRRQVLWLFGASALSGCAASPIGGGSILVGMSEDEEKQADRQASPQQFSQDFGAVQDAAKQAKEYNDAEMQKVTSAFKLPGGF